MDIAVVTDLTKITQKSRYFYVLLQLIFQNLFLLIAV